MTAVLPWYERGPDGASTGRDWPTEHEARAEVGPECTVHQEISDRVGPPTFATTGHTQTVLTGPVRAWKPLGYGGTGD